MRRVVRVLVVASLVAGFVAGTQRLVSADSPSSGTAGDRYSAAVRSLKSQDIVVTDAEPRVTPSVSQARALKEAAAESSFLQGKLPTAHLVYYTERSTTHRLTWLVLSQHATVPIFCCPGRKGPSDYIAGLATFVDASSGKVLFTTTIDDHA